MGGGTFAIPPISSQTTGKISGFTDPFLKLVVLFVFIFMIRIILTMLNISNGEEREGFCTGFLHCSRKM